MIVPAKLRAPFPSQAQDWPFLKKIRAVPPIAIGDVPINAPALSSVIIAAPPAAFPALTSVSIGTPCGPFPALSSVIVDGGNGDSIIFTLSTLSAILGSAFQAEVLPIQERYPLYHRTMPPFHGKNNKQFVFLNGRHKGKVHP
jgi:hypothetical protein